MVDIPVYLQGFIHVGWCRISSINGMITSTYIQYIQVIVSVVPVGDSPLTLHTLHAPDWCFPWLFVLGLRFNAALGSISPTRKELGISVFQHASKPKRSEQHFLTVEFFKNHYIVPSPTDCSFMVLSESRSYQGMPAARFFNTVPNTLFPPLQGQGEMWTFQHWVGGKSEPSGICGWRWWPVVPRSTPPSSTKTRQEQSCGQQGQRLGPPNFSWVWCFNGKERPQQQRHAESHQKNSHDSLWIILDKCFSVFLRFFFLDWLGNCKIMT